MDKEDLKEVLRDIEKEKQAGTMQNADAEGGIDVKELLAKAWKGRRTVIVTTIIFMILGLCSALTMTRTYTATVTLMPELGKSNSRSSLSSITALFGMGGINTGSTSDAYNVIVYPEVVASTPFVTQLFDMHVSDPKNDIDTTLAGYLTRERFSLSGLILKPIFSLFKPDTMVQEKTTIDVFHLTKKQDKLVKAINKSVMVDVDKKTGLTTINVTMDNAVLAATLADTIGTRLRNFITDYRTSKARQDLESYQKMADESYQRYVEAGKAYAYHQDHNRGLILNAVITEGARLSNELNIATQIYQQMKSQAEMARGEVIDQRPVFAIIQPASVPLLPNNSRAKVLIMWTFFGFAFSMAWVLYGREYWAKGKEMLREAKKA